LPFLGHLLRNYPLDNLLIIRQKVRFHQSGHQCPPRFVLTENFPEYRQSPFQFPHHHQRLRMPEENLGISGCQSRRFFIFRIRFIISSPSGQ
jgi:hypothetical protein